LWHAFPERKNQMANPTGKGGFKRGLSGNPGGRPGMFKDIRTLAQQHSAEAIEVLVKLMCNEKASPSARAAAAAHILDRAVGRPEASLSATVETRQAWGPDALDKLPAAERAELDRFAKEWGPAFERWALLIGADENGNGQAQ
jgi:hypothetical protein